jgi:hypothetical protein
MTPSPMLFWDGIVHLLKTQEAAGYRSPGRDGDRAGCIPPGADPSAVPPVLRLHRIRSPARRKERGSRVAFPNARASRTSGCQLHPYYHLHQGYSPITASSPGIHGETPVPASTQGYPARRGVGSFHECYLHPGYPDRAARLPRKSGETAHPAPCQGTPVVQAAALVHYHLHPGYPGNPCWDLPEDRTGVGKATHSDGKTPIQPSHGQRRLPDHLPSGREFPVREPP